MLAILMEFHLEKNMNVLQNFESFKDRRVIGFLFDIQHK